MPTSAPRPRRMTPGGSLVIYVLCLVAMAEVKPTSAFTSLMLIVGLATLLGACTWLSFTRGRIVARFVSLLLVVHLLGTTAWGFVRGFSESSRRAGLHQANIELQKLDKEFAADAEADGPAAAELRQADRRRAAEARLQASSNPSAVALGHAMELQDDMLKAPSKRLLDAATVIGSERFQDIRGLLKKRDFTWHKAAAREYAEAVAANLAAFRIVPEMVERQLATTELDPHDAQEYVRGMRAAAPSGESIFQAHARLADAYEKYLAFAETHRDQIRVDGEDIDVAEGAVRDGYDRCIQAMIVAERELATSADERMPAGTKR
jgi:hypothetical protein